MSKIKAVRKFQKNQIKKQQFKRLRSPKEARRGPSPWLGGHLGRPGGRPHHLAAWSGGASPRSPFCLFISLDTETLGRSPVTRFHPLFSHRRDSDLGIARRSCLDTLPEGGLT